MPSTAGGLNIQTVADQVFVIEEPGHNRYPLSAEWLRKAEQAFTLVREDPRPFEITAEWDSPVRRHQSGELDLTPIPGTGRRPGRYTVADIRPDGLNF